MPATAASKRAAPRTTAPKKSSTKGVTKPLSVEFRGDTFEISADTLASPRVAMVNTALQVHRSAEFAFRLLFELLGPVQSARMIDLCRPGDEPLTVTAELLDAVNTAGGAE